MSAPEFDCATEEDIAELAELFLQRLRAGEKITPTQFAARYAPCEDELLEVLPALMSVEGLGQSYTVPRVSDSSFPEMLGGYKLLEKIGRGGMGTVFRAMQESLNREVAIKILAPSWSDDEKHRDAFDNESRLIASLRHTNIVEVFGAGREAEYRYYVMGLIKGEDLSPKAIKKVYRHKSYEMAVAQVALQAAKALCFAHARGVLHRDIKPSNLLLDEQGVVHVSDFGLATVLNEGELAPLVTQSNDGTLRYMAPERLLHGQSSFASDQYALGLTLYELIAKRPAFLETEPGSLIKRICDGNPLQLQQKDELAAIINKSISYDPSDRYESMAAMLDDLMLYLEGKPVKARPVSLKRRYLMWLRRRRSVAIWLHVALLLMLMLLATAGYGYWRVNASLLMENEQRLLAQRNARIAGASMKRVFQSVTGDDLTVDGASSIDLPSRADAQLMHDLLPYYVEIADQGVNGQASVTDIVQANRMLASIAFRMGDFAVSESQFRRALSLLQEVGSPEKIEYVACVNGLAESLVWQRTKTKSREAGEILTDCLSRFEHEDDYELQLELLRSNMLLCRYSIFMPIHGHRNQNASSKSSKKLLHEALRSHHMELLESASKSFNHLLAQRPDDVRLLLMQAKLLIDLRGPSARAYRKACGINPLDLLDSVLKKDPKNIEAMSSYTTYLLRQRKPVAKLDEAELIKAVEFAQRALAAAPRDKEAIVLFLGIRARYAELLESQGDSIGAELENERTLGVLSFLCSRSDFSEEQRERLIMMIAMLPTAAAISEQQEKELRLLMQSYDDRRAEKMRKQFNKMRLRHLENSQRRRHLNDKKHSQNKQKI